MGNPDVSGVGKNWYLGSSWTAASTDPTEARKNIDAKLDARFTTFTFQLQNAIDKSLTLNQTIPNNLDTSFATANTARINARTAFLDALDDYFPKQTILDDLVASYLPGSPTASDIAAAKADRDAALTTLKTALAAYEASINNQIVVLKQAADLMQISAADFVLDLQAVRNDALLFGQSIIDAAKVVDQAMYNQHLIGNPSIDATVTASIDNQQLNYLAAMDLLNNSSLSAPIEFNTNISFPDLPKSGRLSQAGMGQLMQFAVNLARMVNEMMEQNRRVDSLINELRLNIYSTAGRNEATKTSLQKAYAEKLQQADTNYNYATAKINSDASKDILEQLDALKDKRTTINSAINTLNDEIDDQNDRGVETVKALNSAIQIAADEYKVQLWADHSQLDVLLNQLISQATAAGSAPLSAVSTAAQQVVADLKTISGLLSVRPIDEAAIALVPLAQSQTALSTAITALGTPTADVKATLDGFTEFTQIVITDQTTLQTHIANAEAGAAGAFSTQITAERTSLANYSADITRVISTLKVDDPAIPLLNDLKNAVDPVVAEMNNLLAHLATPPVNLNTIANDQLAITNLLAAVQTARAAINLNSLTGPAEDNVVGIDATINDLEATFTYLTDYTTSTTSTPTPPPGLPGQVKMPLMPAPIQLEHIATIPLSLFNVPSKLPLSNIRPPKDIPEIPTSSINTLNKQIDKINQSLAPVLDRLHEGGLNPDIKFLEPLHIRPYITVRDSSFFIDFTVLDSFFTLLASLLNASRSQESLSENAPNTALFNFKDILGKVNVASGGTKVSGLGAGVGLEGATLTSGAGSISQSLTDVISSTEFSSYVTDLLVKVGIAGGIASLQNLAPVLSTFSQFGVVQSVAVKPATEGLTPEQQLALATGVRELVATVEDVPQIKSELVALLKGLEATQKLSEEELKVLLSLLLFLLQLLALLVGAGALVGAGIVPSLDNIVEKAFEKPQDKVLVQIVRDLETFGIKELPKDSGPASPEFIPTFFNAVVKALDLPRQTVIVDKITAIFNDNGIEIRTDKPIGTAIRDALTEAPTEVAGKVREQLTKLAEEEGTRIREDILRDASKRPSLSQRIKDINPQAFAAIPKEQVDNITTTLNNTAPTVPGLTNEDRNTLVTALIARVITPDQAKGILQQFSQEQTRLTNPVIANLAPELPRVVAQTTPQEAPKDVPQLSLKDLLAEEPLGLFAGKPQLSIRQGTPGELPDLVTQIANSLKELSRQTSDEKFLQETVSKFAETVREQSDFFQKSLTLLLDPANIYVKNFSIISRQTTGHDDLGPTTQIPIAG